MNSIGRETEQLASFLLDVDVIDDRVRDLVKNDSEFIELALARQRIVNAAKESSRTRDLDRIWDELDDLAAERLREILQEDDELDADEVTGSDSIVIATDGGEVIA